MSKERCATDITPPEDHEKGMSFHFIKSETSARIYALTTGGTASMTFIDQLSVYFKFAAVVITAFTSLALLAYYIPQAILKWREVLRREDEE